MRLRLEVTTFACAIICLVVGGWLSYHYQNVIPAIVGVVGMVVFLTASIELDPKKMGATEK